MGSPNLYCSPFILDMVLSYVIVMPEVFLVLNYFLKADQKLFQVRIKKSSLTLLV